MLDSLLASLAHASGQRGATQPDWLNDAARRGGRARRRADRCPRTRDEEWRFTDLSPLTKLSFQPAAHADAVCSRRDVERLAIPEATTRLVFVDGVYAPQLSSVSPRAGSGVGNLASRGEPRTQRRSSRIWAGTRDFQDNVFAALNTAFLHDGALIVVPRDTRAAAPVHLLFIATQKGVASYPRLPGGGRVAAAQ